MSADGPEQREADRLEQLAERARDNLDDGDYDRAEYLAYWLDRVQS